MTSFSIAMRVINQTKFAVMTCCLQDSQTLLLFSKQSSKRKEIRSEGMDIVVDMIHYNLPINYDFVLAELKQSIVTVVVLSHLHS